MPDDPPYILDVRGVQDDGTPSPGEPGGAAGAGKWIGVHFECCGAYNRIYRNRDKTAYAGHCPRCGRPVRVKIGPGGTHHRMFRAT